MFDRKPVNDAGNSRRDRANAARDYLVSRGVARTRIATDGRGSREPVADNNTQQGRDKNRRVEIYVAEQVAGR